MQSSAISDPKVLSTWREQCDRYDQALRKNMARALVAAGICTIALLGFGASPAYIPLLIFGCIFYFFVLRIFWASILMCPRCNEPPQPVGKYTHPRRAIVCDHCASNLVSGVSRMGT